MNNSKMINIIFNTIMLSGIESSKGDIMSDDPIEDKVYTNTSSDSIYVIYKGLFRSYVSSQRKNKCYKEWNYKFIFMKKIC